MKLLVLRPEPGAAATARRASEAGLDVLVAPLFTVRPLDWDPPPAGGFDAILMTSANAARHGGPRLARYRHLPVHAVGEATAAAAREAGFAHVSAGTADVTSLLASSSLAAGHRLLHLCGAYRRPAEDRRVNVEHVPVYVSEEASVFAPEAQAACRAGAVALVHSPRAAAFLGSLVDAASIPRGGLFLVAISDAAARAAGPGWRAVAAAPVPTDAAMLAIARGLCETGDQ